MNIAVAGTGYVGLSIAVLLSQNNHVEAVDIIPEKVEMLNQRKSPIQDNEIEEYLRTRELDLTATLDGESAYADAEENSTAPPGAQTVCPRWSVLRSIVTCPMIRES